MKILDDKKRNLLIVVLLMFAAPLIWGQDMDYDLGIDDLEDDVLESDVLDVDGILRKRKKTPTRAERMASKRKNLEKRNEDLMHKNIEDVRIKEEKRMTDRLRTIFSGVRPVKKKKQQDTVTVVHAAPMKSEVKVEPVVEERNELFKLNPYFGLTSITGDNFDYESSALFGINAESLVSDHFGIGINFAYTKMEISLKNDNYYYYNHYPTYYNTINNRDVEYKHMKLDLVGKYYVTTKRRFMPYLGMGVGFNRSNLRYTDDRERQQTNNGYYYGEEEFITNYISGSAMVGTDVNITENVGINVELKYSRGFTSGFKNKSADEYQGPYQKTLEKLGGQINDADFFSAIAGLVVTF